MRLYRQFISFVIPIVTLCSLGNAALLAQPGAMAAAAGQSQDKAAIDGEQQEGLRQWYI